MLTTLGDKIESVLDAEPQRPFTLSDLRTMIEGVGHEEMAQALAEMEEEGRIIGLRSIASDQIEYRLT